MSLPFGTIKHVVVLMMENRSFDHMLGFMQADDYDIDGLSGNETNLDSQGNAVRVSPTAKYASDLTVDPGHDFLDVYEQMFADHTGAYSNEPAMEGFVANYEKKTFDHAPNVMKCFDPGMLPYLSTLAREYAICTRWFSSIPGPTLPNRAFLHAATSLGRLDMSPNYIKGLKTIYEQFDDAGVSYKIYYQDATIVMGIGYFLQHQDRVRPFKEFRKDCEKNRLPGYSVLEPRYNNGADGSINASDQHPDHDVAAGEGLIRDVYGAIRKNEETWKSTLLIITYDEHGGLYDHVPPPVAVPPDEHVSEMPPFAFDRYGPRVPGVLVSPYIRPGTIDSTTYDHTSILVTARKLLIDPDDYADRALTQRDAAMQPLDGNLNLAAPRQDKVKFTASSGRQLSRLSKPATSPELPLSINQVCLLQTARMLEDQLPQDNGRTVDVLTTEGEAHRYHERIARAQRRAARDAGKGNDDAT